MLITTTYTNSLLPKFHCDRHCMAGETPGGINNCSGSHIGNIFSIGGYIRTPLLFVGSFLVVVFGMMMLSLAEQYYQVCRKVFFCFFFCLFVAIMCGGHANGGGRLCSHKGCAWGSGAEWYMCHRWRWCRFLFVKHRALALATVTSGAAIGE